MIGVGRRGCPASPSVFGVVLASARTADHDHVFLDRDLDGTVARPVLGVDGVVLHGGVEPQPVALVAVVERALQRGAGGATAGPPATAAAALGTLLLGGLVRRGLLLGRLGGALRGLLGGARVLLGLAGGLGLQLGGDRGVVLRAELAPGVGGGLAAARLELLLALERLDLLDGRFELMRDPRVGATLSHPGADLVKLGTQGPAAHAAGRLATRVGSSTGEGPRTPTANTTLPRSQPRTGRPLAGSAHPSRSERQ